MIKDIDRVIMKRIHGTVPPDEEAPGLRAVGGPGMIAPDLLPGDSLVTPRSGQASLGANRGTVLSNPQAVMSQQLTHTFVSRAFVSLLTVLCLVSITGVTLARGSNYGPGDKRSSFAYSIAQRGSATGYVSQATLGRDAQSNPAYRFFRQTLEFIRENYVHEIDEREVFAQAMSDLALGLLPQCLELVRPLGECEGDPEQCFLETIQAVAQTCHADPNRMVVRALKVVLRNLDPNSALMDQLMLNELKITASGKFGGVGMVVSNKDGEYVVISCLEESPAYKAGIKAGDAVLAIDGEPIHGLPLLEVLSKVRGRVGSRISVTIRPRGMETSRRVDLRRRSIRISPVRYTMLDNGIGYLKIVNFQQGTAAEVLKAMEKMFREVPGGLKGLILDLRDNPGGLFDQATEVAALFLPSDTITVVRGRNLSLNKEYKAERREVFPRPAMVVLINRGSASASEILAGALQGKPGVLVMGQRSFGKASVQGVFPLPNGMGLRLTTGYYFTPDGRDINGKGIDPDVTLDEAGEVDQSVRPRVLDRQGLRQDKEIAKALEHLLPSGLPIQPLFSTMY